MEQWKLRAAPWKGESRGAKFPHLLPGEMSACKGLSGREVWKQTMRSFHKKQSDLVTGACSGSDSTSTFVARRSTTMIR